MIHEAFIYESDEEFADVLVPFLREGLAAGQPAIAVTEPRRVELLQRRLGADAVRVAFHDATAWYARPGAAIAAWWAVLQESPGTVRAIGEVGIHADQTAWVRYESMFNRVFADADAWVICPYDARVAPAELLDGIRRSHPVLTSSAGHEPSPLYFTSPELGATVTPLSKVDVETRAPTVIASRDDLPLIRRRLTWAALGAGLTRAAVDDLLMALTDFAADALGEGSSAAISCFKVGKDWVAEIRTAANGTDIATLQSATAFLVGRMVTDRMEVGHDGDELVVRLVFSPPRDPRQRILAAATVLFSEQGFRSTGVNAIIARAGVAKATFYACFASKDDLILEIVRRPESRRFRDAWAEVQERTDDSAEQLVRVFEILGDWLVENEFVGWPLLTFDYELQGANHPAREKLAHALREPEETFRAAAEKAGLADPDAVAAQLSVLHGGAVHMAVSLRSRRPADTARAAAARLVKED
jgi:AcrR family transcriptional regulator